MSLNLSEEERQLLETVTQGKHRLDRLGEEELLKAIQLLESLRLQCAEEGLFEDAESAKFTLQSLREALSVARFNQVQNQHQIQRQKLTEDFDEEMERLQSFWDDKIKMYIDECVKLEQQQDAANQELLTGYHQQLEESLPAKPRSTSKIIELQDRLEKLVKHQEYKEAQGINKKLEELQRAEQAKFEAQRLKKIQRLIEQALAQKQTEKNSLKKRISAGLDELIAQRDREHQKLIQKFNNIGRSLNSQQNLQSKQMERSTRLATPTGSLIKASSLTYKRNTEHALD